MRFWFNQENPMRTNSCTRKILSSLFIGIAFTTLLLTGCSSALPHSGPSTESFQSLSQKSSPKGIQIIPVNYSLAAYLKNAENHPNQDLLNYFTNPNPMLYTVGPGDMLEIYIWEAPPAMLFATNMAASTVTASGSVMTSIPSQIVGSHGDIHVPFAPHINCSGKTLNQIGREIQRKLVKKAHDPQVIVKLIKNQAQSISVIGNVKNSLQVPLLPGGVTVLQALATAGGVDKPVNKVTIQIARNGKVLQLPLKSIITNPTDNISLRAGDVLTALYQPLHLTIMGATLQTKEIDFQSSGISLAEALAKAGGLDDNRADSKAVFLFRFEKPTLFSHWPHPIQTNSDGKVPVIYQFDFSNAATIFAAQTFPVKGNDLIYVAPAPVNDLQKFLGLVVQIVYPIQGLNTAGVIK